MSLTQHMTDVTITLNYLKPTITQNEYKQKYNIDYKNINLSFCRLHFQEGNDVWYHQI